MPGLGRRRASFPRRTALLAALVGVLVPGARVRGDDPPVEPGPAVPARELRADPPGVATRSVASAEQDLAAGDADAASDHLAAAWAAGPDRLVPVPAGVAGAEGLYWPVARVVEVLGGRLPGPVRSALAERLRPAAARLEAQRVRAGDAAALERLCAAPALSDEACAALVGLAEHEREEGRAARAAELLARYLAARPDAPVADRARAVVRRADALEALGDVAGLRRLRAQAGPGAGADAVRHVEDALRRVRPPTPGVPAARPLPTDLVALWALDLTDPDVRPFAGGVDPVGSQSTGMAADAEALLLHTGRRLRRVDPLTGRVRWTFPSSPLGWDHAPHEKYPPYAVPLRDVARAGDLVLAVLGDPCASGSFAHLGQDVDVAEAPRESRARLVALDFETGALRWTSGGARETHPILGDRATCCSGPPLVAGERVYVPFGRRFGTVEHYVACLDRATGALRWLAFLAMAEAGLDPGSGDPFGGRADRAPVRAVPWGARPTLAAGELCVTPHAGLAAGLDPETGRVRWLRALPLYDVETRGSFVPLEDGFSARNAPLGVPGAWVLAPRDAPTMLAVERGSGLLAWEQPRPDVGAGPAFRDLLGLGVGSDGRPELRTSGAEALLRFDPFDGALRGPARTWPGLDEEPGAGRPLDLGPGAVRAAGGALRGADWEPPVPERAAGGSDLRLGGSGGSLRPQDLVPSGPVWVVVGTDRVAAYAPRQAALEALTGPASPPSGPTRAAATAVRARLEGRAETLAEALADAGEDAAARVVAAEAALALLGRWREDPAAVPIGPLLGLLERLPQPQRDRAFLVAAEGLLTQQRDEEGVALLARWIDAPPGLVEVALPAGPARDDPDGAEDLLGGTAEVRGDLVAAQHLRRLRAAGRAAGAFAARDRAAEEALDAALAVGDEPSLREAVRRAAGTPAATRGRLLLRERLVAARRPGDAADVCADLRLDPPDDAGAAAARPWAARQQIREAAALAAAGDDDAARGLLADLLRWVPSGTRDDEGLTTSERAALLAARSGWSAAPAARAVRSVDLWAGTGSPRAPRDTRAVTILGTKGPGAGALGDRFLITRGLTLEVWSSSAGERVAALPADDEGWFGGGLQEVAPWLPEGGVRVTSLVAGEPADLAGVRVGDWIAAFGGRPLVGTADFMSRIAAARPGEPQAIDVRREGAPVLASLTPGRRPAAEGAVALERSRVWAAADGRVLVPGRNGLSWVDPRAARREPLWRWSEPGTVAEAQVVAGAAYVVVRRMHHDDVVVRVDLAGGREVWRREIRGLVGSVKGTGSALHLTVEDPSRSFLLDRADGSVRAVLPRVEHAAYREDRRANLDTTLARVETDASAAGRLWLLREAGLGHLAVDLVNATTCASTAAVRESGSDEEPLWSFPSIAADAYVAVAAGRTLVGVLEADPVRDRVLASARLTASDLLTEQEHHGGALDVDSRVAVGGGTVYVVRVRSHAARGRGVTTMVFARRDPEGALRFVQVDREPPLLSAALDVVLQRLEVLPDGLLLTAVDEQRNAANDTRRGVLFVPAAEGDPTEREGGQRAWESFVAEPFRTPPARSGPWLFLPTDRGADLVPVRGSGGR